MSRAINLPSQSVKLTNVATVRLTVNGKRFEVACYKNKVLDYRAGLETDLSEVLQTSNIHIFTNVTKGQFASSVECIAAFGPNKTQTEMAIQILLRGKSIQVSEVERQQLYDTTLLQIATHIASTCIHPVTGKPYTVSQIKQALTTTSTLPVIDGNQNQNSNDHQKKQSNTKKKNKSNNKKQPSSNTTAAVAQQQSGMESNSTQHQQQHFSIQPHKPIKQQYLMAIKYLQYNHVLEIVRASMELIWYYPTSYDNTVLEILHKLNISSDVDDNQVQLQQQQQQNVSDTILSSLTLVSDGNVDDDDGVVATTTNVIKSEGSSSEEIIISRTIIVDPSLYRILQDYTTTTNDTVNDNVGGGNNGNNSGSIRVPNSRIEIIRQQVFQKQSLQSPSSSVVVPSKSHRNNNSSSDVTQQQQIASTIVANDDDHKYYDDDDSDNDSERNDEQQRTRNNRQYRLHLLSDDDDDDDDDGQTKTNHTPDINAGKVDDDDDSEKEEEEEEEDLILTQLVPSSSKRKNDQRKKNKKKHLQLVQSHMDEHNDTSVEPSSTTENYQLNPTNERKSRKGKHNDNNNNNNKSKRDVSQTTMDETVSNSIPFNNGTKPSITTDTTMIHTGTVVDTTTVVTSSSLYTCNTCIGIENSFTTISEYRAHYRSDWHRYNQKLKCQTTTNNNNNSAPISYSEFITCDAQSFFSYNNE